MEQVVYICIPGGVGGARLALGARLSFVFSAVLWDVERV